MAEPINEPALEKLNEVPIFPRPGVDFAIARYGHFDVPAREYVVTRPDTPQPWYNYITNGHFSGYVSQTGGGTCFCCDPVEKRILRVNLHGRPMDTPGRWVYVRDAGSGKFFSATWAPVHTPLRQFQYECRVGTGYQTISAECDKIKTNITYFVGPEANAETWLFSVTNADKKVRNLDIFPYAEFLYWSLNRDNNLDAAFKCTDMAVKGNVIWHRSYYDFGAERGGWKRQFAYFASSAKPVSFDTNIEAFVGIHRGYDRPLALANGACSNYVNRGGEPIAAMQIPLKLKPGQTVEMAFVVGFAAEESDVVTDARRNARVAFAKSQLTKVKKQWGAYLQNFQADTPSECFNVPFNTWSPFQSAITFLLSRSIAPYLLTGTRGLGFRDSNQDALGAMPNQPYAASKRLIATLLNVQRAAGDACHDFFPGTGEGRGGGCWDDHLWAALSTDFYVKESGDLGFCNELIGYHDSAEKTTVMGHLERALGFAEKNSGRHGLPLLGNADWNDCLNAFPGAESVFTAGLYCAAAKAVESLWRGLGNQAAADSAARRHADMAERINRHAWDGQWYTRLITREGDAIGSSKNTYGKIFIESNTWAVIGQAAPPDRARLALDSCRKYLGTPYGHRICWPAYPEYDPSVGTCTIFSPGIKENAAVFCHTNPWLVVAEAMLGRGDRAYDIFRRISPWTKDQIQNIHCAEPYAVNSLIYMPPNKEAGRARNQWLTGFASWMITCMQRAILGVRPQMAGLEIDPCVPGWRSFRMQRMFRGVMYDIRVSNPAGVQKGVKELRLDGAVVGGTVLPLPARGKKKVRVDVAMG